ncbi:hypothetical protein C4F49_02720 [Sphingobacterium sp. KB22]|uniref:Uncharacterized protein n=1 Tax=Sphingobacterium hungaricum TaxID=2082723 RepID=A0A928UWI1_9SPHI|nr:hypothetical protein [Sphingobacterium hungaricum]
MRNTFIYVLRKQKLTKLCLKIKSIRSIKHKTCSSFSASGLNELIFKSILFLQMPAEQNANLLFGIRKS